MRIISGECRGRKLVQIQGRDIRPTSDRVREALFNIIGPSIRGQKVLDLFAGTGAFGLEALSRGASKAVFLDRSQASCDVVQKNIQLCRMGDKSKVLRHDIIHQPFPEELLTHEFDLIFLDPPYEKGYATATLEKENFQALMAPESIVIAEQSWKETLAVLPNSLDIYRQKKYSKTFISFLRASTTE